MKKYLRRCVACHLLNDKHLMIRIAVQPRGVPRLVSSHTYLPSRSAYLCKNKSCCNQAKKYRKLDKHLKKSISEVIWQEIEALLEKDPDCIKV